MQLATYTPTTITLAANNGTKAIAKRWLKNNVNPNSKRAKKCRQLAKAIVRSGKCVSQFDIPHYGDLTIVCNMLVVRRGTATIYPATGQCSKGNYCEQGCAKCSRYFTDEQIVHSIFAVCNATNNNVEWFLNRYNLPFNYHDALALRRLAPLHKFPKALYNNCI